jgi:hypothetical protein
MKLAAIVEQLGLRVLTAKANLDTDVSGGYASDLLSDVIANSQEKNLWITLQTHQNTIAVAKLKDLAGIIIVSNREPDEQTKKKAEEEKVPLLLTSETSFMIAGKLFQLLEKTVG